MRTLLYPPFLSALLLAAAPAAVVDYELTVAESGKALTLNGGIPGPTLRFREGDIARIRVHNALSVEETSIHWHGLLVPNAMDGVPYLTTPPIPPGGHLDFEFPLRHSGTYWYHSHTGLQEQRGVYGSIVIEPRGGEPAEADREQVVVLSDWTDERPREVMRSLMRGDEWYSIAKGNAQSLAGAIRADALGATMKRIKSRMAAMDISDVAYDAFWINGEPHPQVPAQPGERVRLRVINAAASSYFYLQSSDGPMTVVAADGPAVQPFDIDRLLIGMAETYDLIVTVPPAGAVEFRATAQDGSGHASLTIGEGVPGPVPAIPKPDLYRMDHMLEIALADMEMGGDAMMGATGAMEPMARPGPPYAQLKSTTRTALPASAPRREIELRLTGDMKRYLWSFDGKTLAEDSTIPVHRGEALRVTLINDTMMHHPLHLHGHFFRVIDGDDDAHAPLKHTVDVPPMGRRTIEFLADEQGDWFFHCHLLYHMDAGMARVFSYAAAEDPAHRPQLDERLTKPRFWMAEASLMSHMSMGGAMLMTPRDDFYVGWDVGFHDHGEYEIDLGWSHYVDPNFSYGLGYRLTNQHGAEDRLFAAAVYRLPYLVDSSVQVDSEGDFRFGLGREVPITARLSLEGDVEYDTGSGWEWMAGASYRVSKRLSLKTGYHSEHGFGAGVGLQF